MTRALSVMPGVKYASYKFDLTQYADNGKTVGNLNGAASVQHSATFTSWQPSFDINYKLMHNWSAYAQFATGNEIPPSKTFDVKNAEVSVLPKPTKTRTVQIGSVWKSSRATLDVDAYVIHFENAYASYPDRTNNDEPVYYLPGASRTKGLEAESTIFIGGGLSAYVNGTLNRARYKRIGEMWNDNGTANQAIAIDFNLMMRPSVPKTASTFNYVRDKVLTSRDIAGIHFVFLTLWPDSRTREWMLSDGARVSPATPTIVFAHDPPDSDSKHFINPNGKHDVNAVDTFENLLSDEFADSKTADAAPLAEQTAWEAFVRQHPNITAYFHGHNNWNQFYDWTGPNHSVALHTFRVDSPMKGHFSATDETKLSYQIATIDLAARTMTVREVLWNADPKHPDAPVAWGASTTVALSPRPGR